MTSPHYSASVSPKVYKRFLVFFFLLIIYLTLIPFQFDFSAETLSKGWQETEKIPFLRANGKKASGADIITNIVFFIPFGFFLMSYMLAQSREGSPRRAFIRTLLGGAALSFSVELLQFMQLTRVTSINDLISNILGTLIGALIVRRYFAMLDSGLNRLLHFYKTRPLFLVSTVLFLAHSITLLIPFHFNFKLRRLKRHLYEWSDSLDRLPFFSAQPLQQSDVENFVFSMGITCFLLLAIHWHFQDERRQLGVAAFLGIPFFYFGITLLQLFKHWRGPEAVVLIAIMAGIIAGGMLYLVLSFFWRRFHVRDAALYRSIQGTAWGLYALAFLVHSFYPFQLVASSDMQTLTPEINLTPYATTLYKSGIVYYRHQFIYFILAVLPGFILARRFGLLSVKDRLFRVFAAALALALSIEFIQLLIPTQVSDITDIIIFLLGAGAGAALASYWRDYLWSTQIEQATQKLMRMLKWSASRHQTARLIPKDSSGYSPVKKAESEDMPLEP